MELMIYSIKALILTESAWPNGFVAGPAFE